jgi:hypothetical protein
MQRVPSSFPSPVKLQAVLPRHQEQVAQEEANFYALHTQFSPLVFLSSGTYINYVLSAI